jgi:hypothetical protein
MLPVLPGAYARTAAAVIGAARSTSGLEGVGRVRTVGEISLSRASMATGVKEVRAAVIGLSRVE